VTFVAHVVEFLLIAALVAALGLAAAFVIARSYVRRHWRLVRGHVATRGVLATLAVVSAGRERYVSRATPVELSRGTAARVSSPIPTSKGLTASCTPTSRRTRRG